MQKLIIIFVCFLTFSFFVSSAYADGTYTGIGTGDGLDGSNDAINFSQGRVWTIDQYGKFIWLTQTRNGPQSHWAWSNDNGANWSQGSEDYSFLTRGSVAYDSINDKLHVIWAATDSNDGIIYRRYGITRDGSNNITAIAREDSGNINLQLDTSSRILEQPVALWINDGSTNGILVAIWSNYGTGLSEVRASMRKLSLSAADGVAGNWIALDGTADTFSTDPPNVDADKIYGVTSNSPQSASAIIRGGSGSRKDDIYIFVAQSSSSSVVAYRGVWDNVDKDWSGGFQSGVTVGEMNISSGYNLKEQLITKPVLDSTNDRLYVGWARWKTGGDGDTVSIAYLNSTDTASSTFDAYSSLGTHSYAPTLDIAYDQTLNQIYTSYITSTTNGANGSIFYKTFDGSSFSTEPVFYTSPGGTAGANGSADIPILFENRYNNRLLFAFRINGALPPSGADPHTINWGYITLATPTATPTPTNTPIPTATNTPQNNNGGGNSNNVVSTTNAPQCNDSKPGTTPDLFQIDVTNTKAKIYFSPVSNANNYYVAFGLSPGDSRYGAQLDTGSYNGVLSYEINSLSPSTTYYVRLRGGNGCMPGDWGNEMKFTTTSGNNGMTFYKNLLSRITSILPRETITLTQSSPSKVTKTGNMCIHEVSGGDTLWSIAANELGGGSLFQQLIDQNKDTYPSLSPNTLLQIGWKLKYKC